MPAQTWPVTLYQTPEPQTWPVTLWDGSPPTTGYIWYDVKVEPFPPDLYAVETEAVFLAGDTEAVFLGRDTDAPFRNGQDTRADFLTPAPVSAQFFFRGARATFLTPDTVAAFLTMDTTAPFIKIED